MNNHRSVLTQAHQVFGVAGADLHQPCEAPALEKVAIDDQVIDETQAEGQVNAPLRRASAAAPL
ncbi:hypothetical protein HSBAA_50500 [Vreelandella sulfidaeris]|uniref:Uncharacterized protein n=1 Tax=Vreelandella sulfidaeris TaxID=115553 RepID=A0A455ULB9_9GAMM|nr:hypothetical protein HSBAA_50500 [Halomonas sulfidaeris]